MKILQITAFSGWGCTGRIALGIHNALVENGHESAIAWGRTNTAPQTVPTIQIGNKVDQKVHGLYTRITDKCGFASKGSTKEFLKKLDEYKPDLIQLHIMHGYYINLEVLFNYIKECDIPVVWTFHDCWAFTGHCPYFDLVKCEKWKNGCYDCQQKAHHPTSWFLDNSKWNWNKKKELFTQIKNMAIITPSEWLAGLVKQSFLKEYPVVVINNGINTENFKPTQGKVRARYGLENKKIILGVFSTWCKSKALDDFIQLSKIVNDDYKIVLVGLTKEQKELLPNEIIGIERTDSVQELAEIYTTADVFVNPTYEDNYKTTNLEALACGTPVVTYRTGGSIESVELFEYGSVVEQGDLQGMKQQIDIWVTSTAEQDNKKLLESVDERVAAQKYIQFYEKILYQ